VADVRLSVNGSLYGGWKRVRITRSIESISGSFELDVSDRWAGQDEPWAIAEEDACTVEIDGQVVIDGFVDRRSLSLSGNQRALSYSGRDRAAALVDCSAILDSWTFRKTGILEIARKVAAPFDIEVTVQDGLSLPAPPAKLVINPGDTAFQVIARAAETAELLAVSDGAGGIVLTRAGTGRAAALVQGQNVKSASVDYDATERFRSYIVATQFGGSDDTSGADTTARATATDEGVRRTARVLHVRPDGVVSKESARRRGDWEARIRAARAETVTVSVHKWTQPDGELWPINALVSVRIPSIGVDGDMLITQVEYSLGDGDGETTQLRLVRPDAFTPEPRAVVGGTGSSGTRWKELAGGAR
jgi:prophage tail gpP-like protein